MAQKHWKTAGVVSLIGFLCYVNSLEGDFVYDDSRAIVENTDILPNTPWSNLLFNDFWGTPLKHSGSHRSYRPVCIASFRLNYYIAGLKPWGYHLVNVLLHCVVSLMVVLVAHIVFKENITVSVAGVLFAVHPIHTEAVAGLVGRADVGAGLFYLASWLSYHNGCPNSDTTTTRWSWMFLSMVFAALSMFTKEQGLTVIGVCLLYDVIIISRIRMKDFPLSMKKAKENGLILRIAVLFTTASILLATRMILMNNTPPSFSKSDNPAANSDSFITRTLTFLYLPAMNFWLLIFPHTLCFDWSMTSIPLVESLNDVRNLFSFVFYVSFVLFITLCLKGVLRQESKTEFVVKPTSKNFKNNMKKFGVRNRRILRKTNGNVGHSSLNNSLSNNTVKTGGKIDKNEDVIQTNSVKRNNCALDTNERAVLSLAFLVLPFIPATNLFFYVGFVIAERVLYIPSIGFCLLFAYGFSMFWKSGGKFLKLLLAMITCVYLVLLSARTVRRNIDWRSDENLYRSGIAVNPSKAWSNLGNILKQQGKITEAEKAYKKSIEHKWSADTWYNLGLLYQGQKQFSESVKCYEQAIDLRPRFVLPYLNLGVVMENLKYKEKALDILTQATKLNGEGLKNPKQHRYGVAAAKYHRGRILADMNRIHEAIEVYREAVEMRPDDYPPHSLYNLLGEALFKKGDFQEAELWYRKSLESKPDHLPAFLALAKLLSRSPGRIREADDLYKKALELERHNADVYLHYSKHLDDHGEENGAAKLMRDAVSMFPENFNIVAVSADLHRKIKDYNLAQQYYEKAAELNPTLPSAQMNLGAMYHLLMKFELAEKYYLKTLELAPNDQSTIDNLGKLRNTVKRRGKS